MTFVPSMQRVMEGSELRSITLGHPLVDAYLEFVGARGAVNTWLATAYDLKVFFEVVGKEPAEVTAADVFAFLGAAAHAAAENVVRIEDGEAGLSARTIARRLSSIAGLVRVSDRPWRCGRVERNPVPRGLAGRRPGQRGRGGVRLVRTAEDAAAGALAGRGRRAAGRVADRSGIGRSCWRCCWAGLRRCEVLGLRLAGRQPGRAAAVRARGQGRPGADRAGLGPVLRGAWASTWSSSDRRDALTDACFVVLKGPRRGLPLTAGRRWMR